MRMRNISALKGRDDEVGIGDLCDVCSCHMTCPTNCHNLWLALFADRVKISVTDEKKHSLPVDKKCVWQHPAGLAKHEVGCLSADGGAMKSYFDIWLCMQQAACEIKGAFHEPLSDVLIRDSIQNNDDFAFSIVCEQREQQQRPQQQRPTARVESCCTRAARLLAWCLGHQLLQHCINHITPQPSLFTVNFASNTTTNRVRFC